jgi:hypothetical protein
MKPLGLALGLLLLGTTAQAQTNACDTASLSGNVNVPSATFLFVACPVAAEQPDGIVLELNGVKSYVTMAASGAANAAGKAPYNVSVTLSGRGSHTVRTAAFTLTSTGTRLEGPFSVPFVLVYEKAAPATAPSNHLR